MNGAAVADARFGGHCCQRRDLDGASRQTFDVQTQQVLNRFQRDAGIARAQRFVAAARLERVVAAAGACVARDHPGAGPIFELFDGYGSQRFGAGTEARERGL